MSTPVRDQSRPEGEEDLAQEPKDLEVKKLSPSGLVISGAASATASVVGGQLGVAGTVAGAAVTSVVSAVALALYSDSVHRGSAKLKQAKIRGPRVKDRPRGEAFTSRTASPGAGAAADGDGARPRDESAATTGGPGGRRVVKTVLLALGIALIGLVVVFGIQRVTGTELSPGTGQIQRTVGDSDAVAPREGSGSQQDTPEDTEQQEAPAEEGVPLPGEGEVTEQPSEVPPEEGEVEVETPAPSEQAPAPDTEDGGSGGSSGETSGSGGSGGGSSGEGGSARGSSADASGTGTE